MSKNVVYSGSAPEPIGPYSQAIQAGNMLFVSGQIAIQKSSGKLITDDIETETAQVMRNIGDILNAAGFDFQHVVKSTIFLQDFNDFAKVNEVYGRSFPSAAPCPCAGVCGNPDPR